MRIVAFVLLISLGASGVSRAAEPDTYLFDVLALQPYKGNFARLVKAKTVPDWVKAASSQGEGTAVPMKMVDVGGTPYRLDHICKVHDCAGNTLDVLWAPRGAKVWAALVDGGKPAVMLGDPKPLQGKGADGGGLGIGRSRHARTDASGGRRAGHSRAIGTGNARSAGDCTQIAVHGPRQAPTSEASAGSRSNDRTSRRSVPASRRSTKVA